MKTTMKITSNKPIVGYGTTQSAIMTSKEISPNSKLLWAYYASIQGGKEYSWKANDTIIEEIGLCDKAFMKAKKELVEYGLITSTKRKDKSSLVSVNYIDIALESTTSPTCGNPMVGDNEEVTENTSANTSKHWKGPKSTPYVTSQIDTSNINITNINITNGKTNEKAFASSAIDSKPAQNIFNYLVEQNITELDYKDADRWTMNDRDMENINEDIKNHGEDVILEYIDKHIRNHKRNMVTGTSKYDNVSYSSIHNNVKDNRFR
jgi:hypothetical protein